MPEISHVRISVPEQASLNRLLREAGAQLFPQWLYAEPGPETRILWWGVRGAYDVPPETKPDDPRGGLFPRPVDDWTEAPRGLIIATLDADRAAGDLAPALGDAWHDIGEDALLGGHCRRMRLGRSELVLVEPTDEGYVAACLARFGEGPVAVALDGTTSAGRAVTTNPVEGGSATWIHLGSGPAPYLLCLPAR
jgi:hypothetical protein